MTQQRTDTEPQQSSLTGLQVEVLRVIAKRDSLVESATAPKSSNHWDVAEFETLKSHGAKFSTKLFSTGGDQLPSKISARYRRALAQLESIGLVETFAELGNRTTHAKLTDLGREALSDQQQEPTE